MADITSNLAVYWPLDDGSGTSATDSSGNSNTLALVNTPTWITGQVRGALNFAAASSEHGTSSYSFANLSSAFTFACWMRGPQTSSTTFFGSQANDNIRWNLNSTGEVDIAIGGFTAGTNRLIAPAGTVVANTWAHVAITWDGTELRIHKNGVSVASDNTMTLTFTAGGIYLARRVSGTYFDGDLDELRIYTRCLTSNDLVALMNYARVAVSRSQIVNSGGMGGVGTRASVVNQ